MTTSGRGERPYATALGFYQGDRVEVAELAECGYIAHVGGPESHFVKVQMDSGLLAPLEDFDLTRIA